MTPFSATASSQSFGMDTDTAMVDDLHNASVPDTAAAKQENVTLCLRDGSDDKNNTRCLNNHAVVPVDSVRKSEYFKVLLSERWSSESERPSEIEVRISRAPSVYLKCINFMCSPKNLSFSTVAEALDVLSVASEWLVDECMQHCQKYIAAVVWSDEERRRIREVLNQLQVKPIEDLAWRLGESDRPTHFSLSKAMEMALQDLSVLSFSIQGSKNNKMCHLFEYFVTKAFSEYCDSEIARVCHDVVVHCFKANVELVVKNEQDERAWNSINYLFALSEKCDSDLSKSLIEVIAAEKNSLSPKWSGTGFGVRTSGFNDFINFHESVLRGLVQGKPVTDRSVRFSFLTKCILPMIQAIRQGLVGTTQSKLLEFTKLVIKVAQTLPFEDQSVIFNLLKTALSMENECIFLIFEWWIEELKNSYLFVNPQTPVLRLDSASTSSCSVPPPQKENLASANGCFSPPLAEAHFPQLTPGNLEFSLFTKAKEGYNKPLFGSASAPSKPWGTSTTWGTQISSNPGFMFKPA